MHIIFNCLLLKIDFQRGNVSLSEGYKIQKLFLACRPQPWWGHDTKHMGPPKICFVSKALIIKWRRRAIRDKSWYFVILIKNNKSFGFSDQPKYFLEIYNEWMDSCNFDQLVSTVTRCLTDIEKTKLDKDVNLVSTFKQNKLESEAQKNWDLFYKRNTTNFYKDRHWITREFPELLALVGNLTTLILWFSLELMLKSNFLSFIKNLTDFENHGSKF